ncbi:hypothetical protein BH09PLA1_BH09PLA1_27430 [soil metagenome]
MNHRSSISIALAIAVLPFLLFLPETLGRRAFFVSDFQGYFYPYHKAAADLVRAGNLPLWNPYTSSGMPLLGDGQTALLYPPNWLGYFLRPIHALMLATIFGYSIAGVGMFALGRQLRFDRSICLIGALGFMFGGYMTTQVMRPSISATIALVPWLFFAFERLLERPTAKRCAAASVIVAMQLFAGHPQVPTYTAIALFVYALAIALPKLRREPRAALKPLASLGAMYVGGALLAAIQLLPLLELAKFSPRAAGTSFDVFASNSLVGADWLLFLFPYGYGSAATSFLQSVANIHYKIPPISWERMAYVGLLPLALAVVGICDWRRLKLHANESSDDAPRLQANRLCATVAVLGAMVVIVSIGGLPIAKAVHAIPIIGQFRANAQALGVAALAINLLAMFGASRIMSRERRIDVLASVVAALILSAIAGALVLANSESIHGYDDRTRLLWESALRLPNRNALAPLIVAIAAVVIVSVPIRRMPVKLSLIALLVSVDLGAFARTYNPTVPAADYDGTPGAAAFLRNDPEPFRVAVFSGSDLLPPAQARPALSISWTMAFGIEDINTYNSLQPRRCIDLLVSTKHPDVLYGLLNSNRMQPPFDRALIPLDVKYAILQKGFPWNPPVSWVKAYEDHAVEIRRNPHPIARAFFAELVKPIDDPGEILKEMRGGGFDPLKVALVEGGLSAEEARSLWTGAGAATDVRRISYSANQQTWRTQTTSPRLLVISEMFFPGWRAAFRKNGSSDAWQTLPIYQTNYLFRGVPVPAGDNEIRLIYRPMSVIVGLIVTCGTVIAFAAAVIVARRQSNGAPR